MCQVVVLGIFWKDLIQANSLVPCDTVSGCNGVVREGMAVAVRLCDLL